MLPLGLLLFALDVPFLQKPIAQMLGWLERARIEGKHEDHAIGTMSRRV
jgi:hypothetical protein